MYIIYEPGGRAGQYAPLAANIYKTCTHGCLYCYANKTMYMSKEAFHAFDRTRNDALKKLAKDASKLRGDNREILLCFLGDPYNPSEPQKMVTRKALEILIKNDLRFTVLTKGGDRVRRDWDLLSTYPKCSIGQTIVFSNQSSADYWEPNASPLYERFELAKDAHEAGIKTWVSLEPVIYPQEALDVVKLLHTYIDHWKVGPVHYVSEMKIDWQQFKIDIENLFANVKADYFLKQELYEKAEKVA